MAASVKAKNTAVSSPGMLWVYALCIDVLILSWLCDQMHFFLVYYCFLQGLVMSPLKLSLTPVEQNQNLSDESGLTKAALNV